MAGNVALPTAVITPHKFTLPTGFEQQQQQALMKQKLAEAMLSQGLTTHDDYHSWLQPIAQMFQTWAGKSMQKDATKATGALLEQQRQQYNQHYDALASDAAGGMSSADIVAKYGKDPLLAEALKPYIAGLTKRQESNNTLTTDGPFHVYGSDIKSGQLIAANPNKDKLMPGADGQMHINWPLISADVAAQGLPLADEKGRQLYPTTAPMPKYQGLAAAMGGGQPQTQAPAIPNGANGDFGPDQLRGLVAGLGDPGKAGEFLKRNNITPKISGPQDYDLVPPGASYQTPDGQIRVKAQ